MSMSYRKLALSSAIALGLVLSSTSLFAGETTPAVTEARQESQIWTTYELSPYLRANDLGVAVRNGKATLTGKVDEEVNKDLAKQIALGVGGITEVDNQIVVQSDYAPAPDNDRRRFGDMVDDASISAAVKSKLLWSRHTEDLQTEVDTEAGRVTLQGTADTQDAKNFATRLAMNTQGVRSVDNRLKVDSGKAELADTGATGDTTETTETTTDEMGQDISDSWITTKVKSTFMYSSNVNGADISVSTTDGIVTLSGTVGSGAERALAIEFAENVRGVKRVDSKALSFEQDSVASADSRIAD